VIRWSANPHVNLNAELRRELATGYVQSCISALGRVLPTIVLG